MKAKLLIVDDNLAQFKGIIFILEQNNFEIQTAIHGEDAINVLKEYAPDLILLDVMMPVMDGYELCQYLKNNPNYKHIPIIFLTANNNRNDIIRGFELGASDYITKPIIERELMLRINTQIELVISDRRLKEWNAELMDSLNDFSSEFSRTKDNFEVLLNNLPVAILRIKSNCDIFIANFTYFEYYELDSIDYKDFITGKKKLKFELSDELKTQINRNGMLKYENNIHRKNDIINVSIFIKQVLNKNNEIEFYDVFIENISNLKEIDTFHKKIIKGIEQSASQILITDVKGNIEYVNSTFTQNTGYAFEELIGKNPKILKSGYTSKTFYQNMWNTILDGHDWRGEFFNKKKDGTFYWESAIISPIIDDNGVIISFIAIKDDITHLKKMKEELSEAKKVAEEANNLKNIILQNLCQEFQSPINAILDSTKLLRDSNNNSVIEILDLQNDLIKSLQRTMDTIFKISNYESDLIDLNFTSFNIFDVINKIINNLSEKAELNEVFIQNVSSSKIITIFSDELIIEEVIYQILDNVIKSTHQATISFDANTIFENSRESLSIFIHMNGIETESSNSSKIFETLNQLSYGLTRRYEGLELWLSLVIALVDILKGRIYVESISDANTLITINLPLNN